jgi:hypothetical protein
MKPGFLKNVRGGLAGTGIILAYYLILYIIAFMIAFGNPTPRALMALEIIRLSFELMPPIIGLPLAYIIGARIIKTKPSTLEGL